MGKQRPERTWRKSTYSDTGGGNCVEAASTDRVVQVRDTTDRGGVALSFPTTAWRAFTRSL